MNAISLALLGLITIIICIQYYKYSIHILPYFIVYNILFDVLGYLSADNTINALVRAGFMYLFFAVYIYKARPHLYKFFLMPIIFVIYSSLLIPLSSDIASTVREHLRVVSYFIFMLLMYDYYRNNDNNLYSLISKLPYVLITYILYTVSANIFGLGNLYDKFAEDAFNTGDIVGDFLLQISLCIMLIPIYLYYESNIKKRHIYISLSIISSIFILLSVRRTAVLIVFIGYLLFFWCYKKKTQGLKYSLVFVVIAVTIISIFSETLLNMYEARNRELTVQAIEEEPRTKEYAVVNNLIFSFNDIQHSFFGKNLYADQGVVGHRWRPLHTDYARILYGAGLIGFSIYLIFIINLIKIIHQTKAISVYSDKYKIHYATAMMLLVSKIALSYTGGMHVISYNALLFGTIGALVGFLHSQKKLI